MDLLPSPEQDEIISSSAAFLRGSLPTTRTRELIDDATNVDAKAWQSAAELGWFGLGLPDSLGGVGCGLADEVLLFREIGRSLASGPYVATVLGARVAAFGGDPDLAGSIAAGQQVALVLDGGDGTLQLLDATEAELALLVTPERAALVRIADLADVTPVTCLDPTSRLWRAAAGVPSAVAEVAPGDDNVWLRGLVLVAALTSGIAEATRDVAAEHAKTRVQFDRPIGVHQAVKHPCADMAVQAELAWAQTVVGALAVDEGKPDAEYQALSAKVVAGAAAEQNAAATVQVMGGMGFTFEHDANLFVKRAYLLSRVFGSRQDALSRLIQLPGVM